jgi:hypothetical protein
VLDLICIQDPPWKHYHEKRRKCFDALRMKIVDN